MADKSGLNCEVRELKLGESFNNNKASQYHTIKYDFKPASVDVKKMANVNVEANNQVTVTVPHLDGAGIPQTVFKGNQRPYTKECVLIIDRVTGDITLEKLSSNIQVKKTRQEPVNKPRPVTPLTDPNINVTQRSSSRTRVASGLSRRTNMANNSGNNSRLSAQSHKTPPTLLQSPPRVKTSPPQAAPWSGGGILASLPLIGLDDAPSAAAERIQPPPPKPPVAVRTEEMSSSSSSSDSASDSDSDTHTSSHTDSHPTSVQNGNVPLISDVLNDDLCLSESGSDSD